MLGAAPRSCAIFGGELVFDTEAVHCSAYCDSLVGHIKHKAKRTEANASEVNAVEDFDEVRAAA